VSKPSRRRQPPSTAVGSRPTPPVAGSLKPTAPPTSTATSTSPTGSVRAGRRERTRSGYPASFMERNRTPIVALAAAAGVVLISVFVFFSASAPAYACSTEWVPSPTASPALGAPANPGYVQPDLGRRHAALDEKVTFTYCPPASGPHDNAAGAGPIQPRVYGPTDRAIPQGWIHNLEHGGMVILYRGKSGDPGVTDSGQAQLRALFDGFPVSPVCGIQPGTSQGPVIARFDEMATPYAALVWGRVLPLSELDTTQILDFWRIWGERTNPEPQCAAPSASPGTQSPAASAAPSPAASAAPSPS